MRDGKTYKWANAYEWFSEVRDGDKLDFLDWLLSSGRIDCDTIQEFFQSDMAEGGYFDDEDDEDDEDG